MSLAPVARVALLATLWNPPIDVVAPQGMDGLGCGDEKPGGAQSK